jgi:hypothetical protein
LKAEVDKKSTKAIVVQNVGSRCEENKTF